MANPDPDFRPGMAAVGKQDWKQVEAHMTAYVARSPGDADAWSEVGNAQRKLGNMDAALSSYDKPPKIKPKPKHKGAASTDGLRGGLRLGQGDALVALVRGVGMHG